jgi:prepilin-type N-terminal cleavage/methylation domain-containing protein
MHNLKRRAFTLMELMTVVVIVGLIAAFAIPSFTKAVARADERALAGNMMVMSEAFQLYLSNNNNTYPPDMNTLSDINSTFGIYIRLLRFSCRSSAR